MVGVRFDDRVTGVVKEFAPEAKIIHFDIDAAEINKNVLVDYRVVGDLRWSILLFKEKVMALENDWQVQFSLWRDKVLTWKKEQPLDYDRTAKCIMPQQVIETVSQIANEDTIIVTDVGQHQMWAAQFYDFLKPRRFLTSGGLGTMGYGLPAAIGAKIGKPKKKVVLITGDGSIMMNCQEFATAADYGIDVKVVVMDNHVLGMVTQWQRMFYGERYSQSKLNGKTDFVKLAEAMGVAGYRVTEAKALKTTLQMAFDAEGPALIDVLLPEVEDVLPMVPAGGRLDQMVLGAQIK